MPQNDSPTVQPDVRAGRHPAKFSDDILEVIAVELRNEALRNLLDPFAGAGRIFRLNLWMPDLEITAIDIDLGWQDQDPRVQQGDATALPFADGSFDAIATSPTYGNRLADHHEAKDGSRRYSYRHSLGRSLHPNNSGALQWGNEYKTFHRMAWEECKRVLKPGGVFVLNIKDHIRAGVRQRVTAWHVVTLLYLGFDCFCYERVNTAGLRHGANRDRVPYEDVIFFEKGG